jgi:uncharacterized protein (UPF0333 family)
VAEMFLNSKKGQSTLEYVIVLVGIVIAIMAAKALLGDKVSKMIGQDSAKAIDQTSTKFQTTLDGYGK